MCAPADESAVTDETPTAKTMTDGQFLSEDDGATLHCDRCQQPVRSNEAHRCTNTDDLLEILKLADRALAELAPGMPHIAFDAAIVNEAMVRVAQAIGNPTTTDVLADMAADDVREERAREADLPLLTCHNQHCRKQWQRGETKEDTESGVRICPTCQTASVWL